MLPLKTEPSSYLEELRKLQFRKPNGRTWAMFMIAGGHFAGAIVRVSPEDDEDDEEEERTRKKKPKKPKPDTEVLLHKTFHRYTSTFCPKTMPYMTLSMISARRKQGGSQSTNDNAKGPAKSAGAQLRRYGEQALRDVRLIRWLYPLKTI